MVSILRKKLNRFILTYETSGCFSLIYGIYTYPTGTLFSKPTGLCLALKIVARFAVICIS